jgi:hypothetical protein
MSDSWSSVSQVEISVNTTKRGFKVDELDRFVCANKELEIKTK